MNKVISFTERAQQKAAEVMISVTITLCMKLCGVNIATVNNVQDGRLSLMIDGWKQLGATYYNLLVDFCEKLMGCGPICSYDVSYASGLGLATIIEWRTKPEEERAFLRMLINSRGFVGGGYENLRLYGDRNPLDYRDPELAQQLAARAASA